MSSSVATFPHSVHRPSTMIPVQEPSGHRTLSSSSNASSSPCSGSFNTNNAPHSIQYRPPSGTLAPHSEHTVPGISFSQNGHFISVAFSRARELRPKIPHKVLSGPEQPVCLTHRTTLRNLNVLGVLQKRVLGKSVTRDQLLDLRYKAGCTPNSSLRL